jgi:D-arabinose 1-dehydrogenase-like Zn-dependent alcohol dehydrogenase
MRAQRFYADTKTLAVEDVPVPEPGPGEVLVKVEYCGICHSDLSLINGTFPAQVPVVTQGHEASGTVAVLGPGVTRWAVGDRVIVAAGRPCQSCPNCVRGDPASCLQTQIMAFAYDGAWAEYTLAQAAGLTRIPDNVPFDQAAILADAVSTPFGAVVHTGKASANPLGSGASVVSAATSCSSRGWWAPRRSSPSTSTRRCASVPSNSVPTTHWIRATTRCMTRFGTSPRAAGSTSRSMPWGSR